MYAPAGGCHTVAWSHSTARPRGLCEISNYKVAENLPPLTVLYITPHQNLCFAGYSEDMVSNRKFNISDYKEILYIS